MNRVAEFTGMKERLTSIRKNVRQGLKDTERTLESIENFGLRMRSAKGQMADAFRALGGEYSDEKKVSLTEIVKKSWKWQKNVYERDMNSWSWARSRLRLCCARKDYDDFAIQKSTVYQYFLDIKLFARVLMGQIYGGNSRGFFDAVEEVKREGFEKARQNSY